MKKKIQYVVLYWSTFAGGISAVGPFDTMLDAELYVEEAVDNKDFYSNMFHYEIMVLETPIKEILKLSARMKKTLDVFSKETKHEKSKRLAKKKI